MANSKNSRSNKTAHVLNLLTEPGEAAKEPARTERAPAAAAVSSSEEVAGAIRDARRRSMHIETRQSDYSGFITFT